MIAIDTNALFLFLVGGNIQQAESARVFLAERTVEQSGFFCHEVMDKLAWTLLRSFGFYYNRTVMVLEKLVSTRKLKFEVDDIVAHAAFSNHRGRANLSDLLIATSPKRCSTYPLNTLYRKTSKPDGVVPLEKPIL